MKRLFLVVPMVLAATMVFGSYIEKPFAVANINTNAGTGNLVGTATMMFTNSPFSISSNASFNVPSGQTQNVIIRFDTSKSVPMSTNYVIFTSNGGSVTTSVTGAVLPNKVMNFKIGP